MNQKICISRYLRPEKFKHMIYIRKCGFVPRRYLMKVIGIQNEGCVITFFNFPKSVLRSPFEFVNCGCGYSAQNTIPSRSIYFFPMTLDRSQLQKPFGIFFIHEGHITLQRIKQCVQRKSPDVIIQTLILDMHTNLLRRISNLMSETITSVVHNVQTRLNSKVNVKSDVGEIQIIVTQILDMTLHRKRIKNLKPWSSQLSTFNKQLNLRYLLPYRNYSTTSNLIEEESLIKNKKLIHEFSNRTHKCGDLNQVNVGEKVTLCGWLIRENEQKLLTVEDESGKARFFFPYEKEDDVLAVSKLQHSEEYIVEVTGTLCSRREPSITSNSENAEIVVKELKILGTKSNCQKISNEIPADETEKKVFKYLNGNLISKEKDINDYTTRTHTCGELRLSDVGKQVELCGWVEFVRMSKFILLRDIYGTTQIIIDNSKKFGDFMKELYFESVVCVTGIVCSRPASQVAKHLATGEIEVLATSLQLVGKAIPQMPFHIRERTKVNNDTMSRYRFLALRFPSLQKNLRLRSEMMFKIREFLITKKKFVEVETPTLFKKTPGGAQEFIVPTHFKNKFYSLVQSPQQLKQLLMIGSVDRYFQIARCYRDERTNTERQPEFTQLDVELSFTTVDGVIKLTEDVLAASWPFCKSALQIPFPRMCYQTAMENYGSDKPCILDKFLVKDMKQCIESNDEGYAAYMFIVPNGMPLYRKLKTHFDTLVKDSAVKVYVLKVPSVQQLHQNLCKILPGFKPLIFESNFSVKVDDLVVFTKGSKRMDTLGILGICRHHLINELDLITEMNEKGIYDFRWIVDFPLFEEDEKGGLKSAHHPFTHPHPEDLGLIPNDPLKARSLGYDLVLNGSEVGGGSIRIHNIELQETILKLLRLQKEDFSHLLEALQMGCPPHGGIALGIDRLMAILCNRKSIKDVIAFPKATDGQDMMAGCPSNIPVADKIRYHIPLTDEEEKEAAFLSP